MVIKIDFGVQMKVKDNLSQTWSFISTVYLKQQYRVLSFLTLAGDWVGIRFMGKAKAKGIQVDVYLTQRRLHIKYVRLAGFWIGKGKLLFEWVPI